MNSQIKSTFAAIPVELNNYYPFGMPEAGRSWSYEGEIFESQSKYQDYTYGYNGMQRDNSTGLGSGYTTLFREYDLVVNSYLPAFKATMYKIDSALYSVRS